MILLKLFYEYFKVGLFAVGGGMATIPFLMDMAESKMNETCCIVCYLFHRESLYAWASRYVTISNAIINNVCLVNAIGK